MNNNCLKTSLVYEATVNSNLPDYNTTKYNGLCEPSFKQIHAVHKTNFKKEKYMDSTILSSEIWKNQAVGWYSRN